MTQITVLVEDSTGAPVQGANVTAQWDQPLAGHQKVSLITDSLGEALFDFGANQATISFTATKGLAAGEGSDFVDIIGTPTNDQITIQMAGNIGNIISSNLGNFLGTLQSDAKYIFIFGALGGGAVGAALLWKKFGR